jgi:hypothetical protein
VQFLEENSSSSSNYKKILQIVTEEFKLPLMQIAQNAELGYMSAEPNDAIEYFKTIEKNAGSAMRLLDSYLLGIELSGLQADLPLEPVSLGSILTDSAHQLNSNARQYNVNIELQISNKQPLVMGNVDALKSAFISLGNTFLSIQTLNVYRRVTLATYPSNGKMTVGVFGNQFPITQKEWEIGKQLYGKSRQPISKIGSGYMAGIFIADTILRSMSSHLKPSKYRSSHGFAATLQLSKQLQLI